MPPAQTLHTHLTYRGVRQSYPAPYKGQFQGDDLDDPSLAFAAVHIANLLQIQRENVTEKCMGVEETVHVRLCTVCTEERLAAAQDLSRIVWMECHARRCSCTDEKT